MGRRPRRYVASDLGQFATTFLQMRLNANLTQLELAQRLGISRSYLSVLEGPQGKLPSLELLRKIADVLIFGNERLTSGRKSEKLAELTHAALDLGSSVQPPFEGLIGDVGDLIELEAPVGVRRVWSLTNSLLEKEYGALLNVVLQNVQQGVEYAYFLPNDHGAFEWQWLQCRLEAHVVAPKQLTVVLCPAIACFARFRVLNPLDRGETAIVHLGPPRQPRFYEMVPGQVTYLVHQLDDIRQDVLRNRQTKSDVGGYELIYPPKD